MTMQPGEAAAAAADAHLDELVRLYLAGDESAFASLISATERRLRLFVRSRCHRGEDADEVVNATFVTAFERLPSYEPRGRLIPWLIGIAHKTLGELRRSRWRHQDAPLELALDRLWQEAMGDDPEQRLATMRETLRHCLQQLGEQGRTVLENHHVAGEALSVLAQRYAQTRQAMARYLFTLRNRVRACMEAKANLHGL